MTDTKASGPIKAGYEKTDLRPGVLLASIAGLLALIVIAMVLMGGLLNIFEERQAASTPPPPPLTEPNQLPPEPRLQVTPKYDIARFKAEQDSLLSSYGWIVKEAGIVHIPIDEAMTKMLEKGFPVRAGESKPKAAAGERRR